MNSLQPLGSVCSMILCWPTQAMPGVTHSPQAHSKQPVTSLARKGQEPKVQFSREGQVG